MKGSGRARVMATEQGAAGRSAQERPGAGPGNQLYHPQIPENRLEWMNESERRPPAPRHKAPPVDA